jgi:hypothetical protein
MSILYIPLQDVWAMGFALTMAIALFAMLFVVPFAVVWFAVRGVGDGWRWLTRHAVGHREACPTP